MLAEQYEGKPLGSPNDVTVDGQGRIYFTDQGRGVAVYRIDPGGKIARIRPRPISKSPTAS